MTHPSLFARLFSLLKTKDPQDKVSGVFEAYWDYHRGIASFEKDFCPPKACEGGRPLKPELVAPQACVSRDFKSLEGRCGLIHALAHIEFNAINLALDACIRFQGMPKAYYEDWLQVAKEEAYHFTLLNTHLNALGKTYGDYPAHNGLWEMAQKTAHDPLVRMCCVPRLLEARGLDVAPSMAEKLKIHDAHAATLLEIIMRDEEGHVLIGNRWFHHLCKQRQLDPLTTFKALVKEFAPGAIRPPMARDARARAGFKVDELDWIESVIA